MPSISAPRLFSWKKCGLKELIRTVSI
jgi:hypothetical protein